MSLLSSSNLRAFIFNALKVTEGTEASEITLEFAGGKSGLSKDENHYSSKKKGIVCR